MKACPSTTFFQAIPAVIVLSVLSCEASTLWSVDLQGDGNGGAFGQTVPVLMAGSEASSGLGNVWNAFTVSGDNSTTTNPSLNLVDSDGSPSSVFFSITGTLSGWSQNGSALLSDYIFVNAGNSDPFLDWAITGLVPGQEYEMYAYGSISRSAGLLIDHDGDNNLADESLGIVTGSGLLFSGLTASAGGSIIGRMSPGATSQGDWSGFQLVAVPEPSSMTLLGLGSLALLLRHRRQSSQVETSL